MRHPLAFIAIMLFAFELSAQPKDLGYEPPAGWTYIMNLDSTNQHYLHAYNDTLVLKAANQKGNTSLLSLFSLDGGSTWDSLPVALEPEGTVKIYSDDFFPNSNRMFRIIVKIGPGDELDTVYMKVSNDLGRTYTEYNYGEASAMFLGTIFKMYFHPLDPNQGFWISGSQEQTFVYRTHDGGQSWEPVSLPPPSDGRGVYNEILPDERNPQRWNVLVNGDNHYSIEDYWKTEDNGKSFIRMNHWGNYAGITQEVMIRKEWEIRIKGTDSVIRRYNVGFYDYLEKGDSIQKNWAQNIYGSSANSGWTKGYANGITLSNYVFFSNNPHHAFINAGESFTDTATGQILKRNYHIWETKNDGETWTLIWSPEPPVSKIFLDEKKNTLYVISFYNGYNSANPPHYELWKKQIATSVQYNHKIALDFTDLKITPNPVENFTQISFKNTTSGKVEISLYDILGTKIRTIYSGTQEAGEQKLIWNIPAEIPSGTYFLKLESGGQSASQKIVITR